MWFVLLCAGCFADAPALTTSGDGSGDSTTGATDDTDGTATASATSSAATTQTGETSTDGADASSTGVESECGNGVTEPGEACDDGNTDELDGCTMACALGPRAIAFEFVEPPAPVGTDGSIAQNASCYTDVDGLPRVLAQLSGWRGGPGIPNVWTVSVRGDCARLGLVDADGTPQLEVQSDSTSLPEYGNNVMQIDEWTLDCPAGAVPVGLSGRVYPGGPPNIVALRLECATPTLDVSADPSVILVPADSSPWTGAEYMDGVESSLCPEGTVAVGFRGDIDAVATAIYELGPLCARPVVEVGPP